MPEPQIPGYDLFSFNYCEQVFSEMVMNFNTQKMMEHYRHRCQIDQFYIQYLSSSCRYAIAGCAGGKQRYCNEITAICPQGQQQGHKKVNRLSIKKFKEKIIRSTTDRKNCLGKFVRILTNRGDNTKKEKSIQFLSECLGSHTFLNLSADCFVAIENCAADIFMSCDIVMVICPYGSIPNKMMRHLNFVPQNFASISEFLVKQNILMQTTASCTKVFQDAVYPNPSPHNKLALAPTPSRTPCQAFLGNCANSQAFKAMSGNCFHAMFYCVADDVQFPGEGKNAVSCAKVQQYCGHRETLRPVHDQSNEPYDIRSVMTGSTNPRTCDTKFALVLTRASPLACGSFITNKQLCSKYNMSTDLSGDCYKHIWLCYSQNQESCDMIQILCPNKSIQDIMTNQRDLLKAVNNPELTENRLLEIPQCQRLLYN